MTVPSFLFINNLGETLLPRLELFERLNAAGYQVHLAAPGMRKELITLFEEKGYICHELPLSQVGLNPFSDFKVFLKLFCLIRSIRPIGVLGYTIKPNVYGMWASWFASVRIRAAMITGLGFVFSPELGEGRRWVATVAQFLYRISLKKATHVFFLNADDQFLFDKLSLVEKKKCVVLNGEGVNLNHYESTTLASTNDGIHFLLVARLLADKGIREYVEAAKRVKKLHPRTHFHLVGWVDSNPAAISQKEINEWTEKGYIEFHGRLNDVRPIIAMSHINVLPSYREGVPRVLLEAMAMGRAIITTDAPGCKETVQNEHNGFLVPVKDIDSLYQSMLRFIEEPKLINEMGENSRRLAVEKFDMQKINQELLSLLNLI